MRRIKVGIISDTHGSLGAWVKATAFWGEVDLIIHAGDILYHGPRNPIPQDYAPQELAYAINNSAAPVLFARGNCDSEVDQMILEYPVQNPYGLVYAAGRTIMVHHGHALDLGKVPDPARRYKIDILVTGHTHVPLLDNSGGIIALNPGSAALPKQRQPVPTAAIMEEREIRIIRLDNGDTISSAVIER